MRLHRHDRVTIAVVMALLAFTSARVRAEEESARDFVKRAIDGAPHVPVTSTMTLSSSRGWTRELSVKHKRIGDNEATYMEVTSPHDVADTRFLFLEKTVGSDEQYIYVPLVKRAIRIADEARKQAFLGSDFYVSDLVAPDLEAFTYAFKGEETVEGRSCKLIESVPKQPEGELYSKTVTAVDPADLVVMRTQFYDKKGNLLKVWTVKKLEKIDGLWTAIEQEMVNVQEDTSSQIKTSSVKYHADLSDDDFSRSRLIR